MGLTSRLVRLCRADLHGVMDQLEDKELLMRQYLREMENELNRKETVLKQMTDTRASLDSERVKTEKKIESLEGEIDLAITRDRDDIARFLIRNFKSTKSQLVYLEERIEKLDEKIEETDQCLSRQKEEYQNYSCRCKDFLTSFSRSKNFESVSGIPGKEWEENIFAEEIEVELLRRKETMGKEVKNE